MSERVVNLRDYRVRTGLYVAYALPEGVVRVDRWTQWGNPFRIGAPRPGSGERMTRQLAIDEFRWYAIARLVNEAHWLDRLEGKRLACHCAPKACHGDVLAALVDLVVAARRVMAADAVSTWLSTPAPIFGGMQPRDVAGVRGPAELTATLEAIAA